MKRIFVSHPFSGKHQNLQAITRICKSLVKMGVMPISPCHLFSYLKDDVPKERIRALEFCENLVELADEIWLFGDWEKSDGCLIERNVALLEMIPIYEVEGWKDGKPVFKGEGPKWWMEPSFAGREKYLEFHENRDELQMKPNNYKEEEG